ncbi:hypothetical protein [Phenylobacterium sp.]|uniref:hypothetical protein n=1 Tax=Phenylobacterium sp. TaxID=1871053 RepID=UPI002E3699BB|nr:hypothetical protein [Phenylobacterium sp.]HEX3365740.1 hypothetical protein [Phenylobacterium sp.]
MPKIPRALAARLLVTTVLIAMAAGGPARAAPPAAPSPGPNPNPVILVDTYLALREVAFSTHSEDVEVQAKPGVERAYGVIVEYWQGDQIVTVVGFASGDSSLYYSKGGGMIGGRREPLVASAAGSLVANAQVQLADVPLVKGYPTPDPGSVTVYVLTTAGLRGAQAPQSDMAAADYRLNRLYVGAQNIVSEFHAARP